MKTKRPACFLLALCLALCAVSALAAQKKTSGKFRYEELGGGKAKITEYLGNESTVRIPEKLGGRTVTSIGQYAFMESELTSVVIPGTVTSIDLEAFWGSALRSVSIPGSVVLIGDGAFSECASLHAVRLGQGVIHIGAGAFAMCSLDSVVLPDSVTALGDGAFEYSGLKQIFIPDSVTHFGEDIFNGCDEVTVSCPRGSRAEEYCIDHRIRYAYASSGGVQDDDEYGGGASIAGGTLSLTAASYNKNGRHGVQLKWNGLGEGVTYAVYRKWAKADKPYTRIAATSGTVYLDPLTDHHSGYVYYYFVKATDGYGDSVKSKTQRIQFTFK